MIKIKLLKQDVIAAKTEQDSTCIFNVPKLKPQSRHSCHTLEDTSPRYGIKNRVHVVSS